MTETPLLLLAVLFVAGLFAGATAAIAGGASLFTFPVLLYSGLPPIVANTTNWVALSSANLAALPAFRKEIAAFDRSIWPIVAIVAAGGLAGSLLLLVTEEALFKRLIPILMLFATLLYAGGPALKRFIDRGSAGRNALGSTATYALLVAFSIYGGYFGAGVGFMVLACLALLGYDEPLQANALKNVLMVVQAVIGVTVFGIGAEIAWGSALTVMAGATAGGYYGGRLAHHVPAAWLRTAIIAIGLAVSAATFADIWLRP